MSARQRPRVTRYVVGTLVGPLWMGGEGSKALDAQIVVQSGARNGEKRLRVSLRDWVAELTKDPDFAGPCRIEEAEFMVTREFWGSGTYVKRSRGFFVAEVRP